MFIAPMLLETAVIPFSDPRFVWEPKIDGHRLLFTQYSEKRQLWTRHQTLKTEQYPELLDLQLNGDFCLDGEVCTMDPQTGRVDFELIMERFHLKKDDKIKRASLHRPVNYIVWDIPYYKKDLRHLPPHPYIHIIPQIDGSDGEAFYNLVEQQKLEGQVAKLKTSKFVSKRSSNWLKLIRWEYAVTAIYGYNKKEFGWLAAVEENEQYRRAGTIRFGTNPKCRKTFFEAIKNDITGEDKNCVYVNPRVKALVKFRNWTRNNMLRDPVFIEFVS